MPVVRRATRDTTLGALPGARLEAHDTPESLGSELTRAQGQQGAVLEQAGAQGARVATTALAAVQRDERQKADEVALLKASNAIGGWKSQRLYDPQSGAFTVKGEAAQPLPEQLKGEYDTMADGVGAGLSTPEQRLAFDKMRSQEWQGIDLQVRRHVFEQMNEFRAGELSKAVDNGVNASIAQYLDPAMAGRELGKVVEQIKTNAPRLGMGPEQVDAQVRAVTTAAHTGIISNLLADGKDKAARVYFDATKGQISADKIDEITKALETGELKGRSQKSADAIIAAGGTLTEQRTKAKAIEDPNEREMALQQIEHEAAINDKLDRDTHDALLIRAFDVLDKGNGVKGIAAADWSKMAPGERAAAYSYARQRAEGIPIKTDQATFYALMTQAGDDPETFIKQPLLSYKGRLSDGDFQQLASLQLSIKGGNAKKATEELAGFSNKKDLVENTLQTYGFPIAVKDQSTQQKNAIAELYRMLDRRVDAAQAPGPDGKAKKLTNTEIQGVLDDLLSQSETTPGSWRALYNPWSYDFASKTKRLIDTTIDDVPADARKDIERALRARHRPVSDATILDLYLELQVK